MSCAIVQGTEHHIIHHLIFQVSHLSANDRYYIVRAEYIFMPIGSSSRDEPPVVVRPIYSLSRSGMKILEKYLQLWLWVSSWPMRRGNPA